MTPPGELAIVLHTHMPYVEGFGTWPFGEEWLWEAIATSYLPLLEVLDRAAGSGGERGARGAGRAPVTLSLTPVLCDQLEAPGAIERCLRFLREIRPESHRLDIEAAIAAGDDRAAAELRRSAVAYEAAADRLEELGAMGLLEWFGRHASWTSSATHAVLPLLASDAGIALQIQTGVASHRRRFGRWSGGFWLPECAHAQWLHQPLEEAGVHATCVELTARFGLGDERHLRPLRTLEGPLLWPIDREAIALVWAAGGYPAAGTYRDHHRLTPRHHRVHANTGEHYDPDAAGRLAAEHARLFVAHVRRRVSGGGVCVCAFDTELFGHWWYEGVAWLAAVLDEADRQGLALGRLDDARDRHEAVAAPADLHPASWGEGGDLRTWSGPAVADLAWRARTAELATLQPDQRPGERALRELLALQASDWAFLVATAQADEYPRTRATGHAEAHARALSAERAVTPALAGELRHLAPVLAGWPAVHAGWPEV